MMQPWGGGGEVGSLEGKYWGLRSYGIHRKVRGIQSWQAPFSPSLN